MRESSNRLDSVYQLGAAVKPTANCSGPSLPLVTECRRYESTGSVCRLVHPVRALLAFGGAGVDCVSVYLAGVAASASGWNHAGSRICAAPGIVVSPGPAVGMAKWSAPHGLMLFARHATGSYHESDGSGNPDRPSPRLARRCGVRHSCQKRVKRSRPLRRLVSSVSVLTFYIGKLEVGQIPELESVARLNILRPAIDLGEILVPEEHSARERWLGDLDYFCDGFSRFFSGMVLTEAKPLLHVGHPLGAPLGLRNIFSHRGANETRVNRIDMDA